MLVGLYNLLYIAPTIQSKFTPSQTGMERLS